MVKVIGVRFRRAGKIYYFAPGKHKVNRGDAVIVETVRGVEYGHVVLGPKEIPDDEVIQPLKYVIRKATEQDRQTEERNREKEKEAFKICLEKIRKHGLEMKLIDAEYTFDNNKATVLFYGGRKNRFPGAGKRSGSSIPYPNRAAADRCAGRDEDPRRNRNLRTDPLLSHVSV